MLAVILQYVVDAITVEPTRYKALRRPGARGYQQSGVLFILYLFVHIYHTYEEVSQKIRPV